MWQWEVEEVQPGRNLPMRISHYKNMLLLHVVTLHASNCNTSSSSLSGLRGSICTSSNGVLSI